MPLWVISRHSAAQKSCPLYPKKRTPVVTDGFPLTPPDTVDEIGDTLVAFENFFDSRVTSLLSPFR
jgi:hypothetical protein